MVYIVKLQFNCNETYYIADLDYSLSKNIKDSLIFLNKKNADKIASIVESKYTEFEPIGNSAIIKLEQIFY